MNNRSLGQLGEEHTCCYLQDKGYKILEKNFRNKLGEIDIIAQQAGTICFIEVKTRKSNQYGEPFEAVHAAKQRKIVRVALSYLKYKFKSVDVASRFDVISINFNPLGQPVIEHLVDAFDLTYWRFY